MNGVEFVFDDHPWEEELTALTRDNTVEAMQLLQRRGFPQSRIDGFADVFDTDPEMGITMLSSKAQLKKAEAEKIYK